MSDHADLADLSKGLASLLPFFYIAWADGLLAPAEIEAIRERIAKEPWLQPADRELIEQWLDPADPPDATTYFRWVRTIRAAATHLDDRERTLAELGADLAAMAGEEPDGPFPTPEAQRALAELEADLGIVGREAVRDLVDRRLPPSAGDGASVPLPGLGAPMDVQALASAIEGSHADVRDRVRRLLQDPAFARPDPEVGRDGDRDLVLRWTQILADQGIGALAYPEYAGGQGSIGAFIAAFETIAFHDLDLVVKFGVQFGLWGGSVNGLGSDEQRRELLPGIGTLETPGCFAMSERRHGSNVRDLQTTATLDRDADEWVIHTPAEHDHKEWIGNAARHGRMATVFAQLVIDGEGFGVHAFVVPIRDADGAPAPGVRIEDSGHKMGLNGVDNGRLWFDHVRVPRTALLSRFAQVDADGAYASDIPSATKRFFVMLGVLVGGRIAVGSGSVSAAKCGLAIAVRYAERRRQFGPAGGDEVLLMDYLSHQRRLLPLVARCYGLSFALHALADRFGAMSPKEETRDVETEAAALKAMASWHATRSLQEAREACGGEGYRWSSRIASRKADADIFTTFEGDNTVLQLQVAKNLLAGYRAEFSDLNVFGVLRHVRDLADIRLGEINPLSRFGTGSDHLRDPDWHAALFERRERQLLVTAAQRLKRRIDAGTDSFVAFVEVQDHLLTLAEAHAERLVLDRFRDAVDAADEAAQPILRDLLALYALTTVEEHRGWYLEQGLFEGSVSKAVRAEVNALLGELRPHAGSIIAAWNIPDELLASDLLAETGA